MVHHHLESQPQLMELVNKFNQAFGIKISEDPNPLVLYNLYEAMSAWAYMDPITMEASSSEGYFIASDSKSPGLGCYPCYQGRYLYINSFPLFQLHLSMLSW